MAWDTVRRGGPSSGAMFVLGLGRGLEHDRLGADGVTVVGDRQLGGQPLLLGEHFPSRLVERDVDGLGLSGRDRDLLTAQYDGFDTGLGVVLLCDGSNVRLLGAGPRLAGEE